jgi:hypothetical protein
LAAARQSGLNAKVEGGLATTKEERQRRGEAATVEDEERRGRVVESVPKGFHRRGGERK